MSQFQLITDWQLDAPLAAVWDAISTPERWPDWWRAVARVETLKPGGADGVGAVRAMTWRTALPYTLTFSMRTTRVEPMRLIEGRAVGELSGLGRWTLESAAPGTRVRYEWMVDVTRPWMTALLPLLRPVFAWNHGVVMRWGYEGLSRRLNAPSPKS